MNEPDRLALLAHLTLARDELDKAAAIVKRDVTVIKTAQGPEFANDAAYQLACAISSHQVRQMIGMVLAVTKKAE